MSSLLLNNLESIEIERERRVLGKTKLDPRANVLWKLALESCPNENIKSMLKRAYGFACAQEYKHGGITSDVYFAHALRVASLSILFSEEDKLEVGIIGLLHNVLEVTDIDVKIISREFGSDVAQQIYNLTVERALQWDLDYKVGYYNRLNNGKGAGRLVKIVDKLDNLYLLNLNPNKEIKIKYLKEINKHIIPMVESETPFLINYMNDLVTETSLRCNEGNG